VEAGDTRGEAGDTRGEAGDTRGEDGNTREEAGDAQRDGEGGKAGETGAGTDGEDGFVRMKMEVDTEGVGADVRGVGHDDVVKYEVEECVSPSLGSGGDGGLPLANINHGIAHQPITDIAATAAAAAATAAAARGALATMAGSSSSSVAAVMAARYKPWLENDGATRCYSAGPEWNIVLGGVNHCGLHCRLAKFRGLMINAEYTHVIGCENRTFVWSQSKSPVYGILPANHRAVFCVDHQTTEFRQTTV